MSLTKPKYIVNIQYNNPNSITDATLFSKSGVNLSTLVTNFDVKYYI